MEEGGELQRFDYPLPRKEQSDKTTRWKVDPEDVIDYIMHLLRGDVFDPNELEWKSQTSIYRFEITAPIWVHTSLMNAEIQRLVKFDSAWFSKDTLEGKYVVYDSESFANMIQILEELNEEAVKKNESISSSITKEDPHRLMNEIGLRLIAVNLKGYLNKNIILSNFDSRRIDQIAMNVANDIVKLIYTSHDKFNIKKENFSTIARIVDDNVYSALKRGEGGFFVHHLSTTQRFVEQSNITTQDKSPDKKKWMPNVFGNWGGEKE